MIGFTLGEQWTIDRLVAAEELGRVYLARHHVSGVEVQVKVLDPHKVDDGEVFSRFGREMLATATVDHPNTVRMLDFGDHGIWHYLVLEAFNSTSLEQILESEGRLPWERAVHIASQVASALTAAHAERIIHRNLSPANILLLAGHNGDFVKIRDFGMARLLDDTGQAQDGDITAVDTRVGTVMYMAPEYIKEAVAAPGSDVYSLGALLYHMATGTPPFEGTVREILKSHIHRLPVPASELAPSLPAWIDDLLGSMLRKEPGSRPSAQAVHERITKHCKFDISPGSQVVIGPDDPTDPGTTPVGAPPAGQPVEAEPAGDAKMMRWALVLVVAGICVMVVGAVIVAILSMAV